jgi:[histone H3]-lysine36 N-dimethyltransferase SETMAR
MMKMTMRQYEGMLLSPVCAFGSRFVHILIAMGDTRMNTNVIVPAKCEQRSVIRFLLAKKTNASEIHRQLREVYGEHAFSRKVVWEWCKKFKDGRTEVHDEARSGRPSIITDEVVDAVQTKILTDRRIKISELCIDFPDVSRGTIFEIVKNCLGYKKLCARWVPKMLTADHLTKRMAASLELLTRYHNEGDDFLNRIVTCDETWVSHITPENKVDSMQWKHQTSPRVRKFKQVLSPKKVLASAFWDRKGMILLEFLPYGNTVNADRYCEYLKKLKRAIQNRRRGLLTSGVIFLHDNATPHTANKTKDLLTKFGWDVLNHPPHSPDLAPSDFHLFLHLKRYLGGQRFDSDEEVIEAVSDWCNSQAAEFYNTGIEKLVTRWDKCLNNGGDYVEK